MIVKKEKWIGARVSEEMYATLVKIADKEKVTLAELIRKSMERVIIVFR